MSDLERFPDDGYPATRPPRPAAAGHLVGRVSGAATRVESHGHEFGSETVLGFRLQEPDRTTPRDVELRGRSITGSVRDGDWVEVADRERAGRLEVASLQNLTTGAEVRAAGGSSTSPGARVLRILFVVAFLVVLLFIVWGALQVFGVVDGGWPFGDGGLPDPGTGDPLPGGFEGPG